MSASPSQQLSIRAINDAFSVAPQLEPSSMAAVAKAGYRSVINNRPDGEGGDTQPTSADMEAAALAAGLEYAHLPVSPALQTPQEIAAFGELLVNLPAPVLAFCRSGARAAKLFAAATQAD